MIFGLDEAFVYISTEAAFKRISKPSVWESLPTAERELWLSGVALAIRHYLDSEHRKTQGPLRQIALSHAAQLHDPDQVVEAADKYLKFLEEHS